MKRSYGSKTPDGHSLTEMGEIIGPDCLFFMRRWDKSYYWETMNEGRGGQYASQPLTKELDDKFFFAKPRPRFPTSKPFPFGY